MVLVSVSVPGASEGACTAPDPLRVIPRHHRISDGTLL